MKKSKKAWLTFVTVSSWILAQLGLPTTANAWDKYSDDLNTLDHSSAINLNNFKGMKFKSNNTVPHKQIFDSIDGIFSNDIVEMAHYSHRSHSSHRSHYSHYSGSGYTSGSSTSSSGSNDYGYVAPAQPVDVMPISNIQQQLNDLGYSVGTVDGQKGLNTVQAIKNFQIEYGLPATGIVDWQTEAYLNSTNINIVRAGLQRHGYTFSSGSGRTQEVVAAIYDFQARHGLPQNGRIYLKMKQALGV